ncbi:hypothetical protein FQN53_009108 [Emmonsiellopsis sp. PD_33]|nr:hypothetical protein FQN53_009108 [Emmonsiellopsis sp. PD_33]
MSTTISTTMSTTMSTTSMTNIAAITTGPDFLGWHYNKTETGEVTPSPMTCDGDRTFSTSGTYGTCCPTGSEQCVMATECSKRSIVLENSAVVECTTWMNCEEITIYGAWTQVEPSYKAYMCVDRYPKTLYRELGVDTTSAKTSDPLTTSGPLMTGSPSNTVAVEGGSSGKQTGQSSQDPAKVSAIVFGTIILIAILLLGLLLGRSKWTKPTTRESLTKLHEIQGSDETVDPAAGTAEPVLQQPYTSRDTLSPGEEQSPSDRYYELPTPIEAGRNQWSATVSPISPCT